MSEHFCKPCPICKGNVIVTYRQGAGYATTCLDGVKMTVAYHYLGGLHAPTEEEAVQNWNVLCSWVELRNKKGK